MDCLPCDVLHIDNKPANITCQSSYLTMSSVEALIIAVENGT